MPSGKTIACFTPCTAEFLQALGFFGLVSPTHEDLAVFWFQDFHFLGFYRLYTTRARSETSRRGSEVSLVCLSCCSDS